MDEDDLKEHYMQLQMLDQQIKNAQQQLQTLDQQMMELNNVIMAIDDFKKVEKGANVLVPISAGIFFKAKVEDPKEFTVNV